MPIFAYRCDACGSEKDVLQKRADPPLDTCPSCSATAFRRVLTAPAFQLKGSGWYVTDFRDNGKSKPGGESSADKAESTGKADKPEQAAAGGSAAPAATPAPAPAPAAAPAPAPAQPPAGA